MKRKLLSLTAALLFAVGMWADDVVIDITSTRLTNADLSSLTGWAFDDSFNAGEGNDYTDHKIDGDAKVVEFYSEWSDNPDAMASSKNFKIAQTIKLTAGTYRLEAYGFYREKNGDGTNTKAYLKAGSNQLYLTGLSASGVSSYSGSNDLYKAANAFSGGDFNNTLEFTLDSKQDIEVGIVGTFNTQCSWCIVGPMSLFKILEDGTEITEVIVNPSFESATAANQTTMTGWVNNNMQTQNNTDFGKTGTYYVEAWQPNGTKSITQTISGLPAGQYCLSAHCKARGVTSAKIFAGSNETPITIEDSDADYYVYFTNDGSSSVNIGFEGVGTGANASWIAVDNFQLEYYGTKVNKAATDLPSNGSMEKNGWYSLIIPIAGNYNVTSTSAATIYYTQDGTTSVDAGTSLTFTAGEQKSLSLSAGNLFIKSSVSQVVDVDTRFYLITTVNDERKWLNKNASGITYAYDKGLPFKLESSNGNAVLNFGNGNYLNDVGSNWQTKAEGSYNNEWEVASVEGGYKLLLGVDKTCQLFVANTSTGLVEITHSTNDGNVWQFIQPETALTYAITDAEAHTLGFESGEYAPYNNVTAIKALATAKAATTNDTRVSAYKSLTDATWTVNAAEENAFYDGDFSECAEDNTSPLDYTPSGWSTSENMRMMLKNSETYPGLSDASATSAMMSWPGGTNYGETTGYTMPLNANTIYELKFKAAGWNNETRSGMTVSVLNSSDGLAATDLGTPDRDIKGNESNTPGMTSYTKRFKTGAAGNYVFHIQSGHNFVLTDLELKKATATVLNENDGYTPEDGLLTNVTLNRTIKADKWNTFCVPFDMSSDEITGMFGAGAEVKELTGASKNGDNYTLTFGDASSIVAGKPYMVKVSSDINSINLTDKTISSSNTPTTVGGVTFTGVYTSGKAPLNSFIISDNVFYMVDKENTVNLKAFRGYITVGSGSSVKALNYVFDDDADGIKAMDNGRWTMNDEEAPIYNLAGQRIQKMQKGINIVNGKKIMK